jgi:hypothetical protein
MIIIKKLGMYKSLLKKSVYEGEFDKAKRQGHGKFYVTTGKYFYEGNFVNDKPEGSLSFNTC